MVCLPAGCCLRRFTHQSRHGPALPPSAPCPCPPATAAHSQSRAGAPRRCAKRSWTPWLRATRAASSGLRPRRTRRPPGRQSALLRCWRCVGFGYGLRPAHRMDSAAVMRSRAPRLHAYPWRPPAAVPPHPQSPQYRPLLHHEHAEQLRSVQMQADTALIIVGAQDCAAMATGAEGATSRGSARRRGGALGAAPQC